jgi:superoxide dismutase, Cu-Zn family
MKTLALALLIPLAICAACGRKDESLATSAPAPAAITLKVSLIAATGSSVKGDLSLAGEGSAVSIRGVITGLAPGKEHGFHVHEVGECSLPGFTSAGAHFNPTRDPHGGPKSKARHLGDIPNIKAGHGGHAIIDISIEGVTLVDKDGAPTEILGKALVIHAKPDDYKTQPSGDSGDRVACGVIR